MSKEDIIKSWKDDAFRDTNKDAPDNPAGELNDEHLDAVSGGAAATLNVFSAGCCHEETGMFCAQTHHVITLGCCGPG